MKETINYQYYLKDLKYKQESHLNEYWEQMQDFYEGKQHPEKMKNIPKFVGNICKYLINTKASKLIGTPYSISFQSSTKETTDKLDKFDKFVLLDLKYQTELQVSVINALIYGTEIVLYRFSDCGVSLDAVYEGKLVREHIDLRKFAVANPYINNIQEQKWIMYWNYEEVESVRERCRKLYNETDEEFEIRKQNIIPDNYTAEKYPNPSSIAHGLCLVYTRYFKINGQVCFQSSTKNVDLFDPTFISPKAQKKILEKMLKEREKYGNDKSDMGNQVDDYDIDDQPVKIEAEKDIMTATEYQEKLDTFGLYPFVDFTPNRRFNNFYGISDIQDAISAQKIINFMYSMSAKSVQDNAWGKWLVKEGALRGQTINNNGGQVLIDYSKGNSFGIQRSEANSGNITNITNYAENIFSLIRTVYGATEYITGSNAGQLSGYAISLLQEQGNTVFEMVQQMLWNDFAVKEASVRLSFYLHYYDEKTPFIYELDDTELEIEQNSRTQLIENDLLAYNNASEEERLNMPIPSQENYPEIEKTRESWFSSSDINKSRYYIVPKAGRGIRFSEVVQADQINTLFKDGTIANMPSYLQKAYMEINPLVDETTKSKFKKILEAQEMSENAKLNEQVSSLTQQLEQNQQQIQQLNSVISYLQNYNKQLTAQFKEKLNTANQINNSQSQMINTLEINSKKDKIKSSSSKNETIESDSLVESGVNDALKS